MTGYAKLTAGLIGVWFVIALSTSALHVYRTSGSPIPLGLGTLMPVVLFMAWFAASAGFRHFIMSLNPRILTMIHSWRVAGFVFLILASYGILPILFALPAGCGDIAIGATAWLVAVNFAVPEHRRKFTLWQALGIADLVIAVSLGTIVPFIDPRGIPTAAMTVLPLSLIPTFAVPLLLILHVICIAQARQWPRQQRSRMGERLSFPAA